MRIDVWIDILQGVGILALAASGFVQVRINRTLLELIRLNSEQMK